MALLDTALAVVVDGALGVWLGSVLFFSFVAAPTTFDVLGDDAGRVVNAIFPTYYVFGAALGALAGLAALAGGLVDAFDSPWLAVAALAGLGVAANAYARWVLVPKMERAGDDAFARYHKRSVALNGATMLAVAAALVVSHL